MHPSKFGVSQSVTRKEDDALIRGRGRYVADVAPAGALHAVVVRSPHAHARIKAELQIKKRKMRFTVVEPDGTSTKTEWETS
jgi:CO/xanthine dehydrogenase Mo-binding subunit